MLIAVRQAVLRKIIKERKYFVDKKDQEILFRSYICSIYF